jgi:hypothetical protein
VQSQEKNEPDFQVHPCTNRGQPDEKAGLPHRDCVTRAMKPLANGHLSASGNAAAEPFWPVAEADSSGPNRQFQLLATEKQLTLDGRAEPLPAPVDTFHAGADAPDDADTYAAQASLGEWPQAELPLHPLIDGKPNPACFQGKDGKAKLKFKGDSHGRDGGEKPRVVCECCGLQRCASSKAVNDAERSRDLWNGTKRKKGKGVRIGMRHVCGEAALGVLVVTLPPELRPSASNARSLLRLWERKAYEALRAVLREQVGCADAQFWVRANIHPCGENAQQWKPHLNFMVAGWYFSPSSGRGKRFKPWLDLDPEGPLKTALTAAQLEVFGGERRAQCFWQYKQDEIGKKHEANYVPRTFPEWAHLKLTPQGYGLATSKGRPALVEALDTLSMKPLPQYVTSELREGLEPAPITGRGATEAEARADYDRQLEAHRRNCAACQAFLAERRSESESASGYPEHRRTMDPRKGTGPPRTGPPESETGPDPASVLRWQQFLSPRA